MSIPSVRSMVIGAALLMSVVGCSTQARWVNCEGRLEPINQPAPKNRQAPASRPTQQRMPSLP